MGMEAYSHFMARSLHHTRPHHRLRSAAWTRAGSMVAAGVAIALLGCQQPKWSVDQEAPAPRAKVTPVVPVLPSPPGRAELDATKSPDTPAGFEKADVVGVAPTQHGHAIVLQAGERALPIFVGESEGLSIQLRLAGERFHRPLTHDLMDSVLAELGGTIASVRVERYEEEIFYSVVVLEHHAERLELDSRTSDAIALALGHNVPIFVRTSVLDRGSVDLRNLLPHSAEETKPSPRTQQTSDALEPGTVSL